MHSNIARKRVDARDPFWIPIPTQQRTAPISMCPRGIVRLVREVGSAIEVQAVTSCRGGVIPARGHGIVAMQDLFAGGAVELEKWAVFACSEKTVGTGVEQDGFTVVGSARRFRHPKPAHGVGCIVH